MSTYDEYLGVVTRSHGLDGTVVLSDVVAPPSPLRPGQHVAIGFSRDFATTHRVVEFSCTEFRTTLRLADVKSAEATGPLLDQAVYFCANDLGMDSSLRYRIGDVEGCTVVEESGDHLGTVTDVWLMPANDVWVVTTTSGTTIPLPVIDDVILSVDLAQRSIKVRLLPGLRDIDALTSERDDD
jgi:16S rRNA processing protein RimM